MFTVHSLPRNAVILFVYALLVACGSESGGGGGSSSPAAETVTVTTPPPRPQSFRRPGTDPRGRNGDCGQFHIAAGLVAAGSVPPISPDQVGAFRFLCAPAS